mgnify:CR=1 FL=1
MLKPKTCVAVAEKACELYAGLGYPSIKDYKWILQLNQIKDCPVTLEDAKIAERIWGRNIAALKGKTTHRTADAVKVARELVEPGVPMVVLETALAVKFAETIEEATGKKPPVPAAFEGIEKLPQRVVEMPISVDQVKGFIAKNTGL